MFKRVYPVSRVSITSLALLPFILAGCSGEANVSPDNDDPIDGFGGKQGAGEPKSDSDDDDDAPKGGSGGSAGGGTSGSGGSASGGTSGGWRPKTGLLSSVLHNPTAIIPAQCYTETEGAEGRVHNTCYTCHGASHFPDFTIDSDLQESYAFPEAAAENPWVNLFEDRSDPVAAISDEQIAAYVRESNYFDESGALALAQRLKEVPEEWDFDGDGTWEGYVPDCYFNFDERGFDRDPAGDMTGWRAFAYYPFPTIHWPTNGSMGDVLIRLPKLFRTTHGALDEDVYALNLAIVEAMIKRRSIDIPATDETLYGVDLDKDGVLGTATFINYDWKPVSGRFMSYVGDAKAALEASEVHIAGGLYPVGTEFLSGMRYLDLDESNELRMAARFKELRYARKTNWQTYSDLRQSAYLEWVEREEHPDRITQVLGDIENGVFNGTGWMLQGFIEEADGDLRPQTYEESVYCKGCHGGISATTDSMFAFARKVDVGTNDFGWTHWSQRGLGELGEPKVTHEGLGMQYEYSLYLMYAGTGDDLRANDEVYGRFFDSSGDLIHEMAVALHDDLTTLMYPSPERALALNKSYKTIVEDQDFYHGRETVVSPAHSVHSAPINDDQPTGVEDPVLLDRAGFDTWRDSSPVTPVDSALLSTLVGDGMGGPKGPAYGLSPSGIIEKSHYSDPLVSMVFPKRDTLPVRYVVQNGSIPACYTCHRLGAPTVPGAPPIDAIELPATTNEPGLSLTRLTTDAAADSGPRVSPDGTQIAWVSMRSGVAQVWVMDRDGTNKIAITSGVETHSWPKWSPDSAKLVYWSYDPATNQQSVEVADVASSYRLTIATSAAGDGIEAPEFSPDGSAIAYSAQDANGWDIWIAASDGSWSPRRVTSHAQSETTALWRPGSSPLQLIYKACASGTYSLCTEELLTFDNGLHQSPSITTWADGPNSVQAYDWSPDGQYLSYTAEIVTAASGKDRVSYQVVVDAIGQLGSTTTHAPIIPSQGITLGDRGPVFSPDGSRVAYWAWDRGYRATLWVANVDGTDLQQVTTAGFDMYPSWTADGASLVFESFRSGNQDIWIVQIP